jgi:DNA-binding transcriptional MerR regulator
VNWRTRPNTQVETIRYYEREGLLPEAARTGGNYRIYGDAHAARLSFIRHCRGLDMTLDEIRFFCASRMRRPRTVARSMSCWTSTSGMSPNAFGNCGTLEKQLKSLRELCRETQDAGHCGILNELTEIARHPGGLRDHAGHVSWRA